MITYTDGRLKNVNKKTTNTN